VPLNHIPPTPPESEHDFDGEKTEIDMGEREDRRVVIPLWLSEGALNLAKPLHEIPRKPKKFLPKFNPDKPCSLEDHIKSLFLATCLLFVRYEYVVCRIFPYTFAGKATTWYFILPLDYITSWEDFEKDFIGKFGEAKTPATLYKLLGAIKMVKKEKVKDFNQCFIMVLNKFFVETAPPESLAIEYYTSTLIPSIVMIVKQASKETLAQNFEEVEVVEKELSSYDNHSYFKEIRSAIKKPLLLTKPLEKDPKDMDNMVKLVKKMSNDVVDLNKNFDKGFSRPIPFLSSFKRNVNRPKPPEFSQLTLNLDSFGRDNIS